MRIDVVGAVLRVVFQNEDGGLRPELGMANALDNAAQGGVVLGDVGARRPLAPRRALGVIVG